MTAMLMNPIVETEVAQLRRQVERLTRLKQFVAPEISRLVLSDDDGALLRSHRCDVVVVFFDLRGFTSFVQRADPDHVIDTLRAFHRLIGRLAVVHQATVERFTGDGVMLFFNDPVVVSEPALRSVRMAQAVHEEWARHGTGLGLGTGISQGFATVGAIGSEERSDYAAIGTVTNLAARLCAAAASGQILVCERVAAATVGIVRSHPIGDLRLRGFPTPVPAFDAAAVGHSCSERVR
jgi:class 3 adenylate cyclase